MTDELLGRIVRDELLAIDVRLPDMSPRTLRNTYARRLLIAGRSNEDVGRLLGLSSQRTAIRLRTTLAHSRSDALTSKTARQVGRTSKRGGAAPKSPI